MPETNSYMTYEGSTTHPGCWETTVWIIYNRPIYMTKQELYALRRLKQGSEEQPKAPLGNNVRPLQFIHSRTVRTNIDFKQTLTQVRLKYGPEFVHSTIDVLNYHLEE
ncbi:carbonic anhydrase-related protein 10-like [Diaphorina citri]|uniref:Carbonic anhydrase-related protein 10-like n=1 Tax=Diaphorina citri TaxID=121845 RepID=A0A3Q0IJ63_DIACI|nr:carbonic anhydrase-related protein 10-like [Diaphorina citri]